MVLELADLLKKALPHVRIWLGGPEVSYDSRQLLQAHPQIDGIMRGEGEVIFRHMMQYWTEGRPNLSSIQGITWKDDGDIMENPPEAPVDMNELPFIYEDLSLFENKIIYYESSRGCPYSCSYCLSSIDKHVRFKDTGIVKKELQYLLDAKLPQVKFVDRTFNCRHSHTMEVWQYIYEHDNGITNFHFEITADLISETELELLSKMRPGLIQLEIGVQSTYLPTIEEIHRKVDFEKLKKVVEQIRRGKNIHQHLDLIAGLPYERLEQFKQSFNDVYGLRPHQLQLGFLKVLKGSHMYEKCADYGLVYRTKPMYEVISTNWMSFDDILYLKEVESVLELFYNSHQFEKSMAYLEWFFKTPFELYAALADCFSEHGWHGVNCQRMMRYEQLMTFAEKVVPDMDLFKELLVYDLYARENIKSRPDWAKPLDHEKSRLAQKYSDAQFIQTYLPAYVHESYRTIRHQTHMEPMHYDIDIAVTEGKTVLRNYDILFDYNRRNPLTFEAGVHYISSDRSHT